MKFTTAALSFAAAGSATDIQHFPTRGNVAHSKCSNISSGVCCIVDKAFTDGNPGAYMLGIQRAAASAQLFAYKNAPDVDCCGVFAHQLGTGEYDCAYTRLGDRYEGSRWYPWGPTTYADGGVCVEADTIVLEDGHAFDISKADKESKKELYRAMKEGDYVGELYEELWDLEKDVEGVADRLAERDYCFSES